MMKIDKLISNLQKLQKLYPDADIYFTVANESENIEANFGEFNVDEENNNIEILLEILE